ncbi:MAG: hypothetical protein ACI8PB_002513 [Desulforhopalus sp.]|jgi:hypothetical protein
MREISAKGRKQCIEKYDWKINSREYAGIFKKSIKQ